jgi:hypothetical protein
MPTHLTAAAISLLTLTVSKKSDGQWQTDTGVAFAEPPDSIIIEGQRFAFSDQEDSENGGIRFWNYFRP